MQTVTETSRIVATKRGEGTPARFFADQIEIKRSDDVDVCEMLVNAGCEPPLHLHEREDESFYVLEGRITFFTPGGELQGEPGTYVNLPRNTPHTYAVDSGTARILVTATPSGFASMFAQLAERLGEMPAAPAPEHLPVIGQLAAEYGIQILGPNPRHV